jgi:hypothetical protein
MHGLWVYLRHRTRPYSEPCEQKETGHQVSYQSQPIRSSAHAFPVEHKRTHPSELAHGPRFSPHPKRPVQNQITARHPSREALLESSSRRPPVANPESLIQEALLEPSSRRPPVANPKSLIRPYRRPSSSCQHSRRSCGHYSRLRQAGTG